MPGGCRRARSRQPRSPATARGSAPLRGRPPAGGLASAARGAEERPPCPDRTKEQGRGGTDRVEGWSLRVLRGDADRNLVGFPAALTGPVGARFDLVMPDRQRFRAPDGRARHLLQLPGPRHLAALRLHDVSGPALEAAGLDRIVLWRQTFAHRLPAALARYLLPTDDEPGVRSMCLPRLACPRSVPALTGPAAPAITPYPDGLARRARAARVSDRRRRPHSGARRSRASLMRASTPAASGTTGWLRPDQPGPREGRHAQR